MINRLSIKNFRGIRKGELEDLKQVNVFIGANNSGKSTILEALQLLRAPLKLVSVLDMPVLQELLQRRARRRTPDIREFFHKYKTTEPIGIELSFSQNKEIKVEATLYERSNNIKFSVLYPKDDQLVLSVGFMSFGTRDSVPIQTFWTSTSTNDPLEFVRAAKTLKISEEKEPLRAYLMDLENAFVFLGNSVLVDAELVKKIEEVERAFWNDILEERIDKRLKNSINEIYGTNIEHFNFIRYYMDIRERERDRVKLYAALPEFSMHIDDYGEGLRYALSIFTVASQLNNTALLIEEPEVHQHPGALLPMFRDIMKLSQENHLQLFITTHSLDVVRKLIDLSTIVEKSLRIFHLDLDLDGNLKARGIIAPDAKLLLDLGLDPLRFDEFFTFLVVEGKEDKIFLESIAKKLKQDNLKGLGYEVLLCPKDEQKTTIPALASTGKKVISCIDFDKKSKIKDLIRPFLNSLRNKHKEVEVTDNRVNVKSTGSEITFIPLGLPDDKDLSEAGISQYTMEDYIIKLLCIDRKIQEWTGMNLKELRSRAQSLKDKAALNSSKTLLMTLGVIKGGQIIEELIPKIIDNSESKLLAETLKPFVVQLFV